MNKFRKAIAAGMSATLLASLFTVIAASTALAAVGVTGVGNVPVGGTSTNSAVFTFTEETAGCITTALAGGSATFSVVIAEHAPPGPVAGNVQFTGTPVVTAPGIMGATASISSPTADTLNIKITGSDPINKQQITVTGLKIKAKAAANLGAISATLTGAGAGAAVAACFLGSTGHPTGTITTSNIPAGSTSVTVTVTSNSTTCPFPAASGGGTLKFGGANPESAVPWDTSSAVDGSIRQTLHMTTPTGSDHVIGDLVTASTSCPAATIPFAMTSPGTVVDTAVQDVGVVGTGSGTPANLNPGEQNQLVADTYIYENKVGYIAGGTVITFTISTAGVLFSASPNAQVWTAAGVRDNNNGTATGMKLKNFSGIGTDPSSAVCNLSFDRTSCSVTTDTASSVVPAAILLAGARVDVASTVTAGTAVNIVVTGPTAVRVDNQTVAYVSRVIVGVAAQPTIYINFNDQASGQLSLTEQGAGFFTDGSVTSPNNVFGLCIKSGETFTRAPWAVVTVGDLKLLSGLVGATSVQGTLFSVAGKSCAKWTVYSASTVASTIEIRGSDAANAVLPSGALNGPRYSVSPTGLSGIPGATIVDILVGSDATVSAGTAVVSEVSNAVRAFKSGVIVAALAQPVIGVGSPDSTLGTITISETLAGQLKAGETICVEILPRTITQNNSILQDTFMKRATTNDLPIVTTNVASGLLVSATTVTGCGATDRTDVFTSFTITVSQQSFGPLGVITVSNVHVTTTADAIRGPVLVRVIRIAGGVDFEAVVSPATIGTQLAGHAATRLGVTQVGAFTISTKLPKIHKYVTYRFDFGIGAAGAHVDIWGATKTGNDWSAFTKITSRIANASGVVYYYIRQGAVTWRSYRASWTGGGVFSPARQAHWIR